MGISKSVFLSGSIPLLLFRVLTLMNVFVVIDSCVRGGDRVIVEYLGSEEEWG